MADPVRLLILNEIDRRLSLINKASGYHNTIKFHTIEFVEEDKVTDKPATCMLVGDAIYTPAGTGGCYTVGSTPDGINDAWPVSIVGYFEGEESTPGSSRITELAEKFMADIVKAVLASNGNLKTDDMPSGVNARAFLDSALSYDNTSGPDGLIQVGFRIKYDADQNAF